MKLFEFKIDNTTGLGVEIPNQMISQQGFRVYMLPSVFLKLAAPIVSFENPQRQLQMDQWVASGQAIASPLIRFDINKLAWVAGDYSTPAQVVGHSGRHRMNAILNHNGNVPVEVHLRISENNRIISARKVSDTWIQQINKQARTQFGKLVTGPFFTLR